MKFQFEQCKDRGKIVKVDFDFAMKARERADYSYIYDDSLAEDMLKSSKKLIMEVKKLL